MSEMIPSIENYCYFLQIVIFLQMKGYLKSPCLTRRHLGTIYLGTKRSTRDHVYDCVYVGTLNLIASIPGPSILTLSMKVLPHFRIVFDYSLCIILLLFQFLINPFSFSSNSRCHSNTCQLCRRKKVTQ